MSIENNPQVHTQRQSKIKIFENLLQNQKPKSIATEKVYQDQTFTHSKTYQSELIIDKLQKQVERLNAKNQELKAALNQEIQKCQDLFNQNVELSEKNQFIEREFLNLKYQTKKNIIEQCQKQKKQIVEKIEQYLAKKIQVFASEILKEDSLAESLQKRIEQFMDDVINVHKCFEDQKTRKSHLYYINSFDKAVIRPNSQAELTAKVDASFSKIEIIMAKTNEKKICEGVINKSPEKETKNLGRNLEEPEPDIIVDQYYGELEEYNKLDEKIEQRKNYEMLKNCGFKQAESRRKRIFETSIGGNNTE